MAPFLLDLARAQAGAGLDVHVLAPHDAGLARAESWEGVEVHRFRYAPARWERLAYRGGLLAAARRPSGAALVPGLVGALATSAWAQARRLAPDVLHAHWWFPGGLAGAAAAWRSGLPLVVTLHGSDVHLARRRGWKLMAETVLGRAQAVVAASEALAREAEALLSWAPGRVGVARMPVASAVPLPLPPHPPLRLVAVGRLAPEKGFDVLLGAMGRLVAGGTDVHLEVVGAGPQQEHLARLALPLGARVRWLGPLPRQELDARLAAAHALVAPSRREGLGLVALEALAQGRPVVASRVGGLPEAVVDGEDGLLVPPGDPAALAAALARLPLPAPVGSALARHRPDVVAGAHLDLYRSVLGPLN